MEEEGAEMDHAEQEETEAITKRQEDKQKRREWTVIMMRDSEIIPLQEILQTLFDADQNRAEKARVKNVPSLGPIESPDTIDNSQPSVNTNISISMAKDDVPSSNETGKPTNNSASSSKAESSPQHVDLIQDDTDLDCRAVVGDTPSGTQYTNNTDSKDEDSESEEEDMTDIVSKGFRYARGHIQLSMHMRQESTLLELKYYDDIGAHCYHGVHRYVFSEGRRLPWHARYQFPTRHKSCIE